MSLLVPVSRPDKESYALTIVSEFLRPDHVIENCTFRWSWILRWGSTSPGRAEVVGSSWRKGRMWLS